MEEQTDRNKYPLPEISLKEVEEAKARIAPYAHKTPVLTSSTLDNLSGRYLFFKCEIFQKVALQYDIVKFADRCI